MSNLIYKNLFVFAFSKEWSLATSRHLTKQKLQMCSRVSYRNLSKLLNTLKDLDVNTLKKLLNFVFCKIKQLEEAFNSLRWWDISSLVVNVISKNIFFRIMHSFNFCLQQGLVANILIIASVTTTLKKGEKQLFRNYRPILILLFFHMMLKRITYNRLYNYITENIVIFEKNSDYRLHIQRNILLCN